MASEKLLHLTDFGFFIHKLGVMRSYMGPECLQQPGAIMGPLVLRRAGS